METRSEREERKRVIKATEQNWGENYLENYVFDENRYFKVRNIGGTLVRDTTGRDWPLPVLKALQILSDIELWRRDPDQIRRMLAHQAKQRVGPYAKDMPSELQAHTEDVKSIVQGLERDRPGLSRLLALDDYLERYEVAPILLSTPPGTDDRGMDSLSSSKSALSTVGAATAGSSRASNSPIHESACLRCIIKHRKCDKRRPCKSCEIRGNGMECAEELGDPDNLRQPQSVACVSCPTKFGLFHGPYKLCNGLLHLNSSCVPICGFIVDERRQILCGHVDPRALRESGQYIFKDMAKHIQTCHKTKLAAAPRLKSGDHRAVMKQKVWELYFTGPFQRSVFEPNDDNARLRQEVFDRFQRQYDLNDVSNPTALPLTPESTVPPTPPVENHVGPSQEDYDQESLASTTESRATSMAIPSSSGISAEPQVIISRGSPIRPIKTETLPMPPPREPNRVPIPQATSNKRKSVEPDREREKKVKRLKKLVAEKQLEVAVLQLAELEEPQDDPNEDVPEEDDAQIFINQLSAEQIRKNRERQRVRESMAHREVIELDLDIKDEVY